MAKVLVLMSGGVDSSTAAALLVRQGYEVAGVYLKLYEPRNITELETEHHGLGDPCWAQEMRDAARVAAHLDIPFQVWDVTEEYKRRVLENFYSEYAAGRTPNPDVLCNSEIKFGVGLERALKMGYDFMATGHYARVTQKTGNKKQETNCFHVSMFPCFLYSAVDANKDQSYFLWRLTHEQLSHIMFPIGEYTKPQVRAMARQFGLHNWNKKDSQGVCFLGKIELKEFLYSPTPPNLPSGRGGNKSLSPPLRGGVRGGLRLRKTGPIVDVYGQLLGFHDGLAHFTIGQRHGTKLGGTLSVPNDHAKRGGTGPYFVVEKDMENNMLIVANEQDEPGYRAVEAEVSGVPPQADQVSGVVKCMARTRYRAPLTPVSVHFHTLAYESPGRVVFNEPQRAVAPGQSIVFYDGERVIGGGVIQSVTLLNKSAAKCSMINFQCSIKSQCVNAQN